MKKIISIALVLSFTGCEFRIEPRPSRKAIYSVGQQTTVYVDDAYCENNFHDGHPLNYSWCSRVDKFGDCECYAVHHYSNYYQDCYVEYCYWWDTCEWENYDTFCDYY